MLGMRSGASTDVAIAGQRLREKVVFALVLSGILPLLVLVYVVQHFALPGLAPNDTLRLVSLELLLFFTVLSMLAGGYMIWDLGRAVGRMGQLMARHDTVTTLGRRTDEVGTIMQSFGKMLETIEHQATEINSFASRLDSAYKELESTNLRLKEFSFKDEVTGLYNRRFFSIRLEDRKSTRLNSSHIQKSRMPSSA